MNCKILVAFIRPAILFLLVCVLELQEERKYIGRHIVVVY